MYISNKITEIDEQIDSFICKDCNGDATLTAKFYGECRELWNQNNNAALLHCFENGEWRKVTYDDNFDVQIMHVHIAVPANAYIQYGGFSRPSLQYNMKLLCISKVGGMFERIVKALGKTEDIIFISANNSVESVMRNDLKTIVGNDKNYPPELYAFTVTYGATSIEPEIDCC